MTYRRDPRTAIGDTDYASTAGNPGDISNLTAGATSSFLQIISGIPAWRTVVQATASLSVVTQTLKGLLDFPLFNRVSTELINYVANPNFQADTATAAAASWTATNATQICSSSGLIINNRSMRISPSATLTGTVDGDLNSFDSWVNIGGTDKTLSLTFLSYGDTAYVDNEMEFVVWNSTDSVEVAGTTSTIPKTAKYHKVSWVAVTGKVYKLRFKTPAVTTTHRIYVDSFACYFEQERAANTVLLGPVSGSATVPTYRTIVAEDIATSTPTAGYIPVSAGAGVKPAWTAPSSFPPGMITPYAGVTEPSGWLLCNGATVSQATYAALFAITAHRYGADPGGGNFILPDLRDRMPVGLGSNTTSTSNHDCTTLGSTGATNRFIAAAEVGSHSHTLSSAGQAGGQTISGSTGSEDSHNHDVFNGSGQNLFAISSLTGSNNTTVGGGTNNITQLNGGSIKTGIGSAHVHSLSHTHAASNLSGSTDSSTAASKVYYPPCVTINYIIKT